MKENIIDIIMKKRIFYFLYYWFPVLFLCLVIFIQSSYPAVEELPRFPYVDKLIHFLVYALLGSLFIRGFKNSRYKYNVKFIAMTSILLTGLYGLSDEIHQHYVLYRTADIWDGLFDFFGGVFGVYTYEILSSKSSKRSEN
ncbi:MAG: VanZ family protein [Thermodesulfobacteriota bacterium]|nr:VanZ family protein [Thermodesulfobacteriota bacterium]